MIKSALVYKKEFDSEPVCNKEFLKTKIKSHGDEVTDFYDIFMIKTFQGWTLIILVNHNCYPQALLKECKYIEKKIIMHIIDNKENFPDDSDGTDEE